jgi:hypothetical protein
MAVLPDPSGVHQVALVCPTRRPGHENADYHDESNNEQGYTKTEWIDFGRKPLGNSYAIAGGT